MQKIKLGLVRLLMRELVWLISSLVFIILVFGIIKSLPYKYNPIYYVNNYFLIEPMVENPLLAETIFGKIGIRYRNDIVDNGVIFFGQLHREADSTEIGKRVQLTGLIDIKSFKAMQKNDDCSICTDYQDKQFYYKILDMSDGVYLHIYGVESSKK